MKAMKPIVKIKNINYYANKRKTKGYKDQYDVVFREVGNRNNTIVLLNGIRTKTGFVGGGFGPFASRARQVKLFVVKNWGEVEYIDQRAWDALAALAEETVDVLSI